MSDILIKNMKMPKNCEGCRLIPGYCKHRNIYCMDDNQKKFIRPKDCPLIEVPTPHGRLIDADEAISHPNMAEKNGRKLNPNYDREWFRHCVTYARLVIETSPTIIEAEDGT